MPYSHELRNQRRIKRAALVTAVVVGLFVALFIAPTRMQGWAGLGWGSLFGPEEKLNVEAPSEPPAVARAKAHPGGHLSLPTTLEWTDDVTGCADCNGWQWPYGFELTDLDHAGLAELEESAGASPSTHSLMANASNGGGSSRGSGSAGRSAGGSGGSGGGGGGGSKKPGETSSDEVGSDSGDPSTVGAELQAAPASAAHEASAGGAGNGGGNGGGNGAGNGGGPSAASSASPVSDRPIVDSVVAAVGPVETDNLLLSPIRDSQDVSVGPLASNDPSARRDDVLKAVADSPVGAETIYGEGDAKKVADLVGLGPASAESENGGEQRIDIVPEPATLTLVAITLAGTLYRHRRRRTASCC